MPRNPITDPADARSIAVCEKEDRTIREMLDPNLGFNPFLQPVVSSYTYDSRAGGVTDAESIRCALTWNLLQRLADNGWVVTERALGWTGQGCWVLVNANDWDPKVHHEPTAMRGLGGQALGLPRFLSKEIFSQHVASRPQPGDPVQNPAGLSPIDLRSAHHATNPPAYWDFLGLDDATLKEMEALAVKASISKVPLDLVELKAAVESVSV